MSIGRRRRRLLSAWTEVTSSYPTGPGYDLTPPTRSERFREELSSFISEPSDEAFDRLWNRESIAAAGEWYPASIRNLWPDSLADLAEFFDEIRQADTYDTTWENQVTWAPSVVQELYSRSEPDDPVVSEQARRGLRKFGINPKPGYTDFRDQLSAFRETYLEQSGPVTESHESPIPVSEEIDQLFRLMTSVETETIRSELSGPRGELYTALQGYPAPESSDRGPIDIDFEAATPAIDGHLSARHNGAYRDLETSHWAGQHYEWWKWDFADYVTNEVMSTYDVMGLDPGEIEEFIGAFWANADRYTDTDMLSTPVPQYLLGSWGVVQFADFKQHCTENPEEAAETLSILFDEEEHLIDRLERFHRFGQHPEISDGNLLRVASTFLMGAYPNEFVNFQYERFETFFRDCSSVESLETGFDSRQYYRIVLACRDLRDALQKELDDANMLDVHTLIRLYQDFKERSV